MSENASADDDTAGPVKLAEPDPEDWFLQSLVRMSNNSEVGFELTLTVGGTIISGTLCSVREYFERFGKDFQAGWDKIGAETDFDETIASLGKKPEDLTEEQEDNLPPPLYVHLKNARFYVPGQRPIPSNGLLWRGRIAEVDGFALGTFLD